MEVKVPGTRPCDGLSDYKETILGIIPKDWDTTKLGDQVEDLIVPMRDKPKQFNGRVPWCRIEDFNGKYLYTSKNGYFVDEDTILQMNLKIFPKGTVICSCSAKLGICAIAGNPLITNQTFIGIVPKNTFNEEFLYYLLISYARRLQSLSTGTTISYLPKDKFENFIVVRPPLHEQCKIAAILSSVDAAIEQTDAIIAQTERMKKGLMQEIFTKSIEHLKFKKISDLAQTYSGGTPLKSNANYFNGTIPWIKSGELNNGVITSTNECISEEGLKNSSAKWVPENSILIAMYGATAGIVALLKIRATINQAILAVIPNDQMYYMYLYYYLNNTIKKVVGSLTQGSGQPNLNAGIIKKILVPCPSLSEQSRISTVLFAADQNLGIEKKYREHLEKIKQGLMQDLLTGRVRVKVDGHA